MAWQGRWRMAAAIGAGTLASCQSPSPQRVAQLNATIGKSELAIVQEFGVPTRAYETGGHRFLSYRQDRIESTPGDVGPVFLGGYGYGGFGYGFGYGYGSPIGLYPGYPPTVVQRDCDTTFDLLGGTVQSWKTRGNDCG